MARPSRARRILKWTGVGLSAFFLAAWTFSMNYTSAIVLNRHMAVILDSAEVCFATAPFDLAAEYQIKTGIRALKVANNVGMGGLPRVKVRPRPSGNAGNATTYLLPLWTPFLLTAIPTAWLWHRDRRLISSSPDHRLCLRCGYDLTGNTSGICSECGQRSPNTVAQTPRQ